MEQLLSMGFSHEIASQALAATGGKSAAAAAEWIITHDHHPPCSSSQPSPSPSPSSSQPSPTIQRSLDRFFPSKNQPTTTATFAAASTVATATFAAASTAAVATAEQRPAKRAKRPLSPLSDRMRPRTLGDILGQDHLLGSTALVPSALRSGPLPSLLLWGPPGTGKTSLARAIAAALPHRFTPLSAVTAGVKDVRDAVDEARRHRRSGITTLLFVDEVHRFSKSQQDSFLPAIEDGSVIFIGATTENPSFHLTTPLLSRSRVLALRPLEPTHIQSLLSRAAADPDRGLPLTVGSPVSLDSAANEFLSLQCDGDARVALNALEAAAILASNQQQEGATITVTIDNCKEAMQCKHVAYDRDGEEHYNIISALHKSIRGNDPNAAIYWLARMLEGGEQPLYIARRLVRMASEDVGLADPGALGRAVASYQACHFLGMPECDVCLAQCVADLALAPKSIAVYRALGEARRVVKESGGGNEGVPLHLRNAPTKLMKEFGYGKGYIYTPDQPDAEQAFLPLSLHGRKFLDWPPLEGMPQ